MSIRLDFSTGTVDVDIQKLVEKLNKATLEELDVSADSMVDFAQMLCRKDTGALAESIRKEVYTDRVRVTAGGYVINPKTGKLVNYAAIREAEDHFMHDAWALVSVNIEERIKERAVTKTNE